MAIVLEPPNMTYVRQQRAKNARVGTTTHNHSGSTNNNNEQKQVQEIHIYHHVIHENISTPKIQKIEAENLKKNGGKTLKEILDKDRVDYKYPDFVPKKYLSTNNGSNGGQNNDIELPKLGSDSMRVKVSKHLGLDFKISE